MGTTCSCYQEEASGEVLVSKHNNYKMHLSRMSLEKPTIDEENKIVIEFAPLNIINPILARNLAFQSIAKGFLTRLNVSNQVSQKNLALSLQKASRGFLARQDYKRLLKSKLFGMYKYVSGHISERTLSNISTLEETLKSSRTDYIGKLIEDQALVEIEDDVYYQGQWNEDKKNREGFGMLIEKDGTKYMGNFEDNQKSGYGVLIWPNNSYYEGEFCKGTISGLGRMYNINGQVLKGYFANGKLQGKGSEKWQDGIGYRGNFVNSKKHGKGILSIPGISVYEGEFVNDMFEGKGILTYDDGKSYNGMWKEGQMHGKGIFKWPSGKVYEGEYFNGQKHGTGKMTYNKKKIYNGEWVKDVCHGKAVYTFWDRYKKRMRSLNSLWENGVKVCWLKKDGSEYD